MTHGRLSRGVRRAGGVQFLATCLALGVPCVACGPSGSREIKGPPVTVVRGTGGAGGFSLGTGGAPSDAGAPESPNPDPDPDPGTGGMGPVVPGTGGAQPSEPDAALPPDVPAEPPPPPPPPPDVAPEPDLPPAPDVAVMPDVAAPDTAAVGLSQGLISRWTLEEGTGTAVKDSMNVNPGMVSGAVWAGGFRNPPSKSALHFDGDNDYVELGVKNLPGSNKPQTVAFWFRLTGVPGANTLAIAFSTANTGSTARLKLGVRAAGLVATKSSQDVLVAVAGLPALNTWHHLAWAFDGRTNYLYLDGIEKARTTTAPDNTTMNSARIGAVHNNAENFNGDIDDVRIYGRAITAGEAAALAAGQE